MESAIVLPLVILFTMVLFDGALYMKDFLTAGYAAKGAVQAESAAGNNGLADYFALQQVKRRSHGLDAEAVERIIVYKATSLEEKPHADCIAGIPRSITSYPDSACNVYSATDMDRPPTDFTTAWPGHLYYPATGRNTTRSTEPDLVGVYVQAKSSTPTGALGRTSWTIKRATVMQLEARRR